jgi:hypothetical protein
VFIDWNKDYLFDIATEKYDLGFVTNNPAGVVSTNITIPNDANLDATRMRVSIQDLPNLGACLEDHSSIYGETEDYTVVIQNNLDVGDEVFKNFSIFPNPNNGIFTVSLESKTNNPIKIGLFDVLGRTISLQLFKTNTMTFKEKLHFNNLSQGVYFLKISQDKSFISKQIIIQ